MTPEERDELNREIAERLFGCVVRVDEVRGYDGAILTCTNHEHWPHPWRPDPQTWNIPDFAGTWDGCGRVVETMREQGYAVVMSIEPSGDVRVTLLDYARQRSFEHSDGGTLPEAVALAARAALRAEAGT